MLRFELVTPSGSVLDREVDEVLIPGVDGEFGVLPGHIPFLAAIQPGVVTFRANARVETVAVGRGFAEVGAGDHVMVLTQTSAHPADVDPKQARQAFDQAKVRLQEWAGPLTGEDGDLAESYKTLLDEVAWHQATVAVVDEQRNK